MQLWEQYLIAVWSQQGRQSVREEEQEVRTKNTLEPVRIAGTHEDRETLFLEPFVTELKKEFDKKKKTKRCPKKISLIPEIFLLAFIEL